MTYPKLLCSFGVFTALISELDVRQIVTDSSGLVVESLDEGFVKGVGSRHDPISLSAWLSDD